MGTSVVYTSADASAPVLTGAAGTLNALLYACLVTGYGTKAALGWVRSYNDAVNNVSVFRQASGPQHYVRVNDNGPGVGTFKEARVVGYESMSDVNTGTNPFPTAAQMANGAFVRKSATADATARPWILVGTGKVFYLFMYADSATAATGFGFGSAYSIVPTDGYATFLAARDTENSAAATADKLHAFSSVVGTPVTGNYMARTYTGIGTSVAMSKWGDAFQAPQAYAGASGGITYPSPADGSLVINPISFATGGIYRGVLPGLWNIMHLAPLVDGDTLDGVGGLASRSFRAVSLGVGQLLIETSTSTWEEN